MQNNETLVGILHEVSGFTYDTLYDLYFTTERMIAVLVLRPDDVMPSESMMSALFTGWLSKRKETQERRELLDKRHSESANMDLEKLISSNKASFEIRYSELNDVEIKKGLFRYHLLLHPKSSKKIILKKYDLTQSQVQGLRTLLKKITLTVIDKN